MAIATEIGTDLAQIMETAENSWITATFHLAPKSNPTRSMEKSACVSARRIGKLDFTTASSTLGGLGIFAAALIIIADIREDSALHGVTWEVDRRPKSGGHAIIAC